MKKSVLVLCLAAALLDAPVLAAEQHICERGVVMQQLGTRPIAGSGVVLVWIELTFKTREGKLLPIQEIYLGGDQKFPPPGAVCTVCYRIGTFESVVMPVSNIETSTLCNR